VGKRLLVAPNRYAAYFPQERPVEAASIKAWDESGDYLGVGVAVYTRSSGIAISVNGARYDSNHVIHWISTQESQYG
jgi:hypothetical protein